MLLLNNIIDIFQKNQNSPIVWIIGIALICMAIKVVNKLLKTVSSIAFLVFIFIKLFGVNAFLAFFK